MSMDLFTAMQQLASINGGNNTDNTVNQNTVQSTEVGQFGSQPFNTQQVGGVVETQPFNTQQVGSVVEPLPFSAQPIEGNVAPLLSNYQSMEGTAEPLPSTTQAMESTVVPQPFNPQTMGGTVEPQPFNPQTMGGTVEPQPFSTEPVAFDSNDQVLTEETNTTSESTNTDLAQAFNNQNVVENTDSPTTNNEETTGKTKTSKKSTSKKSTSKKSKDNKNSPYLYQRDIEMPVKFGGIERFKMPLTLELHGMDEFEYMKNRLAELGVAVAKQENFVIEEQDDYFRLVKVARVQSNYHSKG